MIIQQVINGMRRGQQIFIPNTHPVKGTLLPLCTSFDERPTEHSPTVALFPISSLRLPGGWISWMVIEE